VLGRFHPHAASNSLAGACGDASFRCRRACGRSIALRFGLRRSRAPSISHSRTGFYWHAIEAALADRDWTEVERYAALLDESVKAEPLPLIDRIVARARTLAAAGRSNGAPTGTAQ
jgi:hypothetical protein